jgi:predicted transcriptional regulator of viral defense system
VDVNSRAYGDPGRPQSRDEALAALAGGQHGVVSWPQLAALGYTKHSVRSAVARRRLLRLHTGVYAVGHAGLTDDSRRLAAVMACGPGALLSHRAAAELHRLLPPSPQFEVTVPQPRRQREGVVLHRSRAVHPDDRALVRAIPVTTVARTLVDLAEVLNEHRLAKAVHEAEVRRVFDLTGIERVLERVPGRAGRHRLRRVLAAYRPEPRFTRSRAERRLLRLCERHGLPKPQTNVWIHGAEVDAYWEDVGVVVEVDGGEAHLTRRAFREDRARDRRLAAAGIGVVRVTWFDFDDEPDLARELALIRQGRRRARSR